MAEYVNITKDDMSRFLSSLGFKEVKLDGVKESVFGKIVAKNLCLRVYTGIVGNDSRDKGKDAIRVALFFKKNDGSITKVAGGKRVHRVKGWKDNLSNRIDAWKDQVFPPCSKCGSPTVERTNKKDDSKFLGCIQYPECKSTRSMP